MNAVILAGGLGTRLRPLTTNFPKPMMPIGDLPILEILIRQLAAHGTDKVVLLTGHLSYLIEGYIGDGSSLGVQVSYVRETEPRGTAGPLATLAGVLQDDFLVMNGDLLTDADFGALWRDHRSAGDLVTIGSFTREERLDLGVLTIDDSRGVMAYDEKPTLQLDVSMGLYAMKPEVLERIPARHYDMPDLIRDLLSTGTRVGSWRHSGVWLDIGRLDDYEKANTLYSIDPGVFLGDRQ